MSYTGQNKYKVLKTLTTNESLILGSINLADNYTRSVELLSIAIDFERHDFTVTNETAYLELHHESTCSSLLATSDIYRFNLIPNVNDLIRWSGMINFTFNNVSINQKMEYWVKLYMQNYTRTIEDEFLCVKYDWPLNHSTNTANNPIERPIRMHPLIRA